MQAKTIVRIYLLFFFDREFFDVNIIPRDSDEQDKRVHAQNEHMKSFLYDCHVRDLRFIPKKEKRRRDLFLLPRFCFLFRFIYIFFLNFISYVFFSLFFSFRQLTILESIVILSLSSCFILVKSAT